MEENLNNKKFAVDVEEEPLFRNVEIDEQPTIRDGLGNETRKKKEKTGRTREKTWFIILMLILFFPVGLYLMWRYAKWNKIIKIIITVFFAAILILGETDSSTTESTNKSDTEAEFQSDKDGYCFYGVYASDVMSQLEKDYNLPIIKDPTEPSISKTGVYTKDYFNNYEENDCGYEIDVIKDSDLILETYFYTHSEDVSFLKSCVNMVIVNKEDAQKANEWIDKTSKTIDEHTIFEEKYIDGMRYALEKNIYTDYQTGEEEVNFELEIMSKKYWDRIQETA